jgi:hypothetical protein
VVRALSAATVGYTKASRDYLFSPINSVLIDTPYGVLQGKLVGFVFRTKNFVKAIVLRWSTVPFTFGVLMRQGIPGNPAATFR